MELLGRMRLSFLVVAGALLGALFIATQVSAAVSGTLAVGSATIAPGDVGTVSVTASAPSPGLGAWSVDVIVMDPSQVSVVSCVAESHSVCNAQYRTSPPTVRFAGAAATGLVGQVTLGTVTVRCASSEGSSTLGLDTVGFADATVGSPVEIAVTLSPGTIRCARAAVATSMPQATPTSVLIRLPPSGNGGSDSGNALPAIVAAFAGVGVASVAGYRLMRVRARHT